MEIKGTRATGAVQGMKWGQGLSDGEGKNSLEMESGQMVSSSGLNEHLSIEQGFHEKALV